MRRLIEISENLHRAELSVLERAKLVKEWVEMTTENQVPQVGAAKPQYEQRGVRLAARQLPVEGDTDKAREHRIARDLKIASLSPEAQDAAREVGLERNDVQWAAMEKCCQHSLGLLARKVPK